MSPGLLEGLTENRARTAPDHPDPRLRTRTYTIPFDRVWSAILVEATARSRWELVHVDDEAGVIEVVARTRFLGFEDDVRIEVALDRDGFTCVDLESASRLGKIDLGTNARRIRGFLAAVERRLRDGAAGATERDLGTPNGPRPTSSKGP